MEWTREDARCVLNMARYIHNEWGEAENLELARRLIAAFPELADELDGVEVD